MPTYTCSICGKQFDSKYVSVCCPECKIGTCVVCGKQFKRISPYTQKTCSSKCRGIYRKESGIGKAVGEKMKQTKLEKYGTLDPTAVTIAKNGEISKKKCIFCGKEFTPRTPRQVYCDDKHYGPCPVCGKPTEIKDFTIGPQACSEECRMKRIQATCLEKYGNIAAVNSEHARKLSKETCLEKYGVDHYSKTEEYHEKVKQTNLGRYGTEWANQNEDVKEKGRQTNREKYGYDYHMQRPEYKEQFKEIMDEKYGGIGLASPELKEKIVATNIERYGVESVLSSPEVQSKIRETNLKRYGSENFWSSNKHLSRIIADPSKSEEFLAFKNNPREYVENKYNAKPTIYVLCRDIGITDTTVYDILIKNQCQDVLEPGKRSTMEYEIINFLKDNCPDVVYETNCRKVITPYELDFYFPDKRFAIECNPTVTHNSSFQDPWGQGAKSPSYHGMKSKLCSDKRVQLFHIFGYEWNAKRDIIESMILNSLGYNLNKIFARNTEVVELNSREANQFLNANHRQGGCGSKIRLGLRDIVSGEVVSVMTFGVMRPTLGKIPTETDTTFELVRFCSKLNTSVVGGASKLLKHFEQKYNPDKIVSFSDVAHTKGTLYETLGFHKVSVSDPSYVWVSMEDDSYFNRVSCQKSNIPNLFSDVKEEDIKNHTERELMKSHGYAQVFDSGVIRWEK